MKKRLFLKLLISYVVYGIIAFVVIITLTTRLTTSHMIKTEATDLYREASRIAGDYGSDYYKSNLSLDEFQKHMEILSEYLSADIWITNSIGDKLVDSADSSVADAAASSEYESVTGFNIRDFGNKYYQTGDFYNSYSSDVLTVFYPINVDYENRGYVLIHKPLSQITNDSDEYTNISFLTVGIIILVGLLIFVVFTLNIYLPLMKISKAAKDFTAGDFSTKIDIHSNDEIGYVANTINYMANELDTLEEDQRKFVSNVSHDFRSPLTSIKGYVEAMLDGTIPVEIQDKYLNIILFETNRLTKLTQSLIELNQFGHHGIRLDIADFDINQMIKTTILTFEGTCSKKGITFDLVLTGKELFVSGDMTKIQQVLYNLIDNATKFSHHDSSIKIETMIKNDKVLVSVKDHGIGIPAESIKKIWERFYKTDSSRGKDKKGSGLGLAIVKEIITAHNEHINVISTEGAGTEFIFTLQLSKKERE